MTKQEAPKVQNKTEVAPTRSNIGIAAKLIKTICDLGDTSFPMMFTALLLLRTLWQPNATAAITINVSGDDILCEESG